ncbi:MAG: acyl carrier protein [Chloroflexi bacterium]|nr:MAG: acyl carrier protein [Chloroflexota bacterium]
MTTQQQVFEYIRTKLNPNASLKFDPAQNLLGDGILDSLAMMDLIVWLEQTFGITIETEDLVPENFGTLNAMAVYVAKACTVA